MIDGGAGADTASYAGSGQSVTVDLNAGTASGGDAQGDVLSNIENVTGSDYSDTLTGDSGANVLSGGAGNDILEGGAGADNLDGGAGLDTASYAGSGQSVTVDLNAGTASGGDAQGDVLSNIENLTGSDYSDTLTGDSGANVLTGGGGADVIDGGAGVDTASYAGSGQSVTVDLDAGTASGGDAQGDVLSNIENLTGSGYSDTLTGDSGANVLSGGAGNDVLRGEAGDDTVDGGVGTDTAVWSGTRDEYFVNDNGDGTYTIQDTISGRNGTDTVSNVENFQFDDGVFNQTEVLAGPTDIIFTSGAVDWNAGINVNTDGGNNAYLQTTDGGSIIGGLTALTIEVDFSSTHAVGHGYDAVQLSRRRRQRRN